MARFDRGFGSSSSTDRYGNTPSSPGGDTFMEGSDIRTQLLQTPAYRNAYKLFSQPGVDPIWMDRLAGIVALAVDSEPTWFDEQGLVSNWKDKQRQQLLFCIDQINVLVADYQSHVNSLPSTQVSQLSQAGINSAVTGQGISSSVIPDASPSVSPDILPSYNAIDGYSQIASFASSASGGMLAIGSAVANTLLAFKDLGLRRDQFEQSKVESFAEFKSSLAKDGIIIESNSWEELGNDRSWFNHASARSKNLYNAYQEYVGSKRYGPLLMFGQKNGEYNFDNYGVSATWQDDEGNTHQSWNIPGNFGASLLSSFAEVGEFEANLLVNEMCNNWEIRNQRLDEKITDDDVALAEARSKKYEMLYNGRKASIYLNRVIQLQKQASKGNFWAQLKLNDMMFDNTWQESLMYMLGENPQGLFDEVKSILTGEKFSEGFDFFAKSAEAMQKWLDNQ